MLESNRQRVKNLTGAQIWLLIVGRVLAGFGVGVLAMVYFPSVAAPLGWPALVVGALMFAVAARSFFRRPC